jgi:hypothetical protein
MAENNMISWVKDPSIPKTYSFRLSSKLMGKLKRKGIWSPDGSGEIGNRKLRFSSNGKANMVLTVFDGDSEQELGKIKFYWKDFQRSTLKLTDGASYTFRSFDLIRGVWSWIKQDGVNGQFIFRMDTPIQRSGTIENQAKDLSAQERDILLLLGLHLQHYINNWMITIVLLVVALITGR